MQLQIPRQQHWVRVSSGLNAISSTHCATDSVSYALLVIRPLVSLTLCSTILILDKESNNFQACEWAPSFLQLPLSANTILLEAWEEETEGWTRCGINSYKRLLLWLFPPFSQYLSTSQKTQRSRPVTLLAAVRYPGCQHQSWGEKPGDTTAREEMRTRV